MRRPYWDDSMDIAVKARAGLRLLTDGVESAFCFSAPEAYDDPDRLLTGLYTPAGRTEPLRAALTLGETGMVKSVLAYKEQGRRAMPRAVTPDPGDTFVPFVHVFRLPEGRAEWEIGTVLSAPLTFGGSGLWAIDAEPLPGDYLAGVVVQDLDGRSTRRYVPLRLP